MRKEILVFENGKSPDPFLFAYQMAIEFECSFYMFRDGEKTLLTNSKECIYEYSNYSWSNPPTLIRRVEYSRILSPALSASIPQPNLVSPTLNAPSRLSPCETPSRRLLADVE